MREKEIAKWLYEKILEEQVVFQYNAVREIEDNFGQEYIYVNKNGNKAISEKITAHFRKINKGNLITWDGYGYKWVLELSDREVDELLSKF